MSETPLVCLAIFFACAGAEAVALVCLLTWPPTAWKVENYRGLPVIGRAGTTLLLPTLAAAGLSIAMGVGAEVLVAAGASVAFCHLGYLDDAFGSGQSRGLKGHFAALLREGKVSTGVIKALGGTLVSAVAVWCLGVTGWRVVPAAAVVALSANALNSLDARPGRASKAFIVCAAALLAMAASRPLTGASTLLIGTLGAAVVYAPFDLRERVLLGDSGANPLGCTLGMAVVLASGWPVWIGVAAGLLAFCAAADRWSLSATVDAVPLLGWIDGWGRGRHSGPRGDDVD